jgi:hypothetical protein
MIRLIDEVDAKRSSANHMVNKKVLVRKNDEVFISKISIIDGRCYVLDEAYWEPLDNYDGWIALPIYELDFDRELRNLNNFLMDD